MIYSLEVEKHCLGGLLKYPHLYPEIAGLITDKDFESIDHQTIFLAIRNAILEQKLVDKVLIAERLRNLGVKSKDGINIFDYVEALDFTQINEHGTIKAFQELRKISVRREVYTIGTRLQKHAKESGNYGIDRIIGESDRIYNEPISGFILEDEPTNLFEGLQEMVEERGNNPIEDVGLLPPYPEFSRLFGGYRDGNIYAVVSRAGIGKSTFLFYTGFSISKASNFQIPVLYLDTEMDTVDMQWRAVAALTDINTWYLETGNWRKYPDMVKKVRAALSSINNYCIYHYRVGNKTIDQVCALARRWHYTKVGRGKKGICIYDYLKITGETINEAHKEHMVMGEKVDRLKKLAEELNVPILTAMQMNRSGDTEGKHSKNINDDSTAVALTDRLQWFGSHVAILRKKTLDEIKDDGEEWGTHKYIVLKARFQGRDSQGHGGFRKRTFRDGATRYVRDYINMHIHNFAVTEKGSLKDIIEDHSKKFEVENKNPHDGEINLE